MDSEIIHKPVMLNEVLDYLEPFARLKTQTVVVDATLGAGNYTKAFLDKGFKVLAIEADPTMLTIAKENLERTRPSFDKDIAERHLKLIPGNFADLASILENESVGRVNAIVFDLGVSTQQLKSVDRGFSFQNPDSDLDMRVNKNTQNVKASDLLNALNVKAIEELFEVVCLPHEAKKLANLVVAARSQKPFKKVGDFLELAHKVFRRMPGKKNPATKPFLALRLAVNSELSNLNKALSAALKFLAVKGRIIVVTFHSKEDAIVKHTFIGWEEQGLGKVLTKKAILPSEEEINENARARSAKLRVFEKND